MIFTPLPCGLILASGSPLELNFGQSTLSRADSCQWVNVSFIRYRIYTNGKVTEHEVALVAAYGTIIRSDQGPLTFPIRRSIPLPRKFECNKVFLRHHFSHNLHITKPSTVVRNDTTTKKALINKALF